MSDKACFHCHAPLPAQPVVERIAGRPRSFCCSGCSAVAGLVAESGLQRYYDLRQQAALTPQPAAAEWQAFDRPVLRDRISRPHAQGREILLHFAGVQCAACAWLLRQLAEQTPAIVSLEVNPATARGSVVWDESKLSLSELLQTIAAWGYRPTPESGDAVARARQRESRQALSRLAVAGIGMMQVMMYAIGLYLGDYQGMDQSMRQGLRWFSLVLSIPVLWYAGWPILRAAWDGLHKLRPVMDQPVALALILAWTLSVWHTLTVQGEVYFEAVTMFVFFLTLARYLEMQARQRAADTAQRMAAVGLVLARRYDKDGGIEAVSVEELQCGDQVMLAAGDTVPADGSVIGGEASVDESLLTGEAIPRQRGVGAWLAAGSQISSGEVLMRVSSVSEDSSLGHLQRMLIRAESLRPQWSATADRLAGYFIVGVLLLAALVGAYWARHDPGHAFAIVLSVLVITCPCALSLAAPTALAAATAQLARRGIFIGGAEALGRLARVQHMLLDKTGTLTEGRFRRCDTQLLAGLSEADVLAIAASLMNGSRHPVAQAFADISTQHAVSDLTETPGQGVSGVIDGRRYRIGRPHYASADGAWPEMDALRTVVALAGETGPLAVFSLADQLRPGALDSMNALRRRDLKLKLISGDRQNAVREVAEQLAITDWQAEMLPEDKLTAAKAIQAKGESVAMVGDGINDAPVLAGADVAIALASGAAIPKTQADVVLTGNHLSQLDDLISAARQTETVIRQNLIWALAYNLLAVPAAAAGFVAPWLAALGMSLSSLVVVLNARRAGRETHTQNLPPNIREATA